MQLRECARRILIPLKGPVSTRVHLKTNGLGTSCRQIGALNGFRPQVPRWASLGFTGGLTRSNSECSRGRSAAPTRLRVAPGPTQRPPSLSGPRTDTPRKLLGVTGLPAPPAGASAEESNLNCGRRGTGERVMC
ncbi:unnamed protein product [Pieris brassicae]|uniref:Uncharacterized protein n=1 Tax=Pieris brassicae TaxID=7116 RepID=A0A9P0THK1_PIEBR|nr:unnamed protein product [Pieris brassicae]